MRKLQLNQFLSNLHHVNRAEDRFVEAQKYVGNTGEAYFIVGEIQKEFLIINGCASTSNVLEVGCGCLVAGFPIMDYLDADRYVGIEPNTWLIKAAIGARPGTLELVREKRPLFIANDKFDATETARRFDFVISHSILSHAAHWQYPLFLKNLKKVLAPNGMIIASIRMTDQNGVLVQDSNDQEWVYPGNSYFSMSTVKRVAEENGFQVTWKKEYRDLMTQRVPSNFHDWIILTVVSS